LVGGLGLLQVRKGDPKETWEDVVVAIGENTSWNPLHTPKWQEQEFKEKFVKLVTESSGSAAATVDPVSPTEAVSLEEFGRAVLLGQPKLEWYGVRIGWYNKTALTTIIAGFREAATRVETLKPALSLLQIPAFLIDLLIGGLRLVINAIADAMEVNLRRVGYSWLNAVAGILPFVST
jgi:hypothetical protein